MRAGEVVQKGDEFRAHDGSWGAVNLTIGRVVDEHNRANFRTRRP